jgi:hypothetical protein
MNNNNMLFIIILLNALLMSSASFENKLNPNCKKCKWYMPNLTGGGYELGRCRMFFNKDTNTYRNTLQCRLNSDYCGMDGSFYETAGSTLDELKNQIYHLEQFFNGEICEEKEMNNLEAEINVIKQKIKFLEMKIKDKDVKN